MNSRDRIAAMRSLISESKEKRLKEAVILTEEIYENQSTNTGEDENPFKKSLNEKKFELASNLDSKPRVKKGRPKLEDKRKKRVVYLNGQEKRQIRSLFNMNLSKSIRELLKNYRTLKIREKRQLDIIKKLLTSFREEAIQSSTWNSFGSKSSQINNEKLSKIASNTIDYLKFFGITNLNEIRYYFTESEMSDLEFILVKGKGFFN